jgi:hypothetical protein
MNLKVGDLAEIAIKRFTHFSNDSVNEVEGKIVVVTKMIDSSEDSGSLVECFIDNQFVIFPTYCLRRLK